MLESLFTPIFTSAFETTAFICCTLTSLILGAMLALIHNRLNRTTASMLMTIVMLPFVVQTVMMLVNGNIGTGIAISGAFGLVRFRSIQCKPEEIIIIFAATAIGLATSAGYIGVAVAFTLIFIALMFAFRLMTANSLIRQHKELRITVPEGVSYDDVIPEVLNRYCQYCSMQSVRTSNMGSLYKLTFDIVMNDNQDIRNLINELRIINGNLEISIGAFPETGE